MGAGLFGKLPAAGDFVARGLPAGLRAALDGWLTAEIAPLAGVAVGWPEGGLRAALSLAGDDWLCLIEPSEDGIGRAFPLVACVPLDGADRAGADGWADSVWPLLLRATETGTDADALLDALAQIPPPAAGSPGLSVPALWWSGGEMRPPGDQLPYLRRISSG